MINNINNSKIEVLSPVGDYERLKTAILYGADAVYLGGVEFGMRAVANKFDRQTLIEAVAFAHNNNVKVYVTCNTVPKNEEVSRFPDFLESCVEANVDALIVADIGILSLIKKQCKDMEMHISTQAGIMNYASAQAFYDMGASRVVLARELSIEDISTIRQKTSPNLEIEAFVHGAMCMAISGRCLISNYFSKRDANRGQCAQPCRWEYYLIESKRPDVKYPIFEDEKGTHILNAKDLCMIKHIDKLISAGVTSLKIEGRSKSAYYVAVTTNAYRMALDKYLSNPNNYVLDKWLFEEVSKISHRQYSTGFYFGISADDETYENGGYIRNYDVVAVVDDCKDGYLYCTQRNKLVIGSNVELFQPKQEPKTFNVHIIYDENNNQIESTPHSMMKFKIPYSGDAVAGSMLRCMVN